MSPVYILIKNLFITVVTEGLLVLIFSKKLDITYHSILVNMLTNPLINIIIMLFLGLALLPIVPYYYIILAISEIAVVITEGVLYWKMGNFSLKKAFFFSFLLNACSYGIGTLVQ